MEVKAAGNAVAVKRDFMPGEDGHVRSSRRDALDGRRHRGAEYPREWIEMRIALYQAIIRDNPEDADAHLKIGMLYLWGGDRWAAREEYRILRNLFPSMADELLRKWNMRYPAGGDRKKQGP